MSAARGAAAALLIGALSALAAGDELGTIRRGPPREFPEGAGRAVAERACRICHAPTLVTQQAKDSTGWEKTLTQMTAWGAPLLPAERDSLRGYLLSHFGPRRTR